MITGHLPATKSGTLRPAVHKPCGWLLFQIDTHTDCPYTD